MSGYIVINFLIYCIINAFTPGPGNILALNTVTNYGWKRGKNLFFGIFAGYYVVQLICGVIVFAIGSVMPEILGIMKYVGAAYILWLAIHIAVSKPNEKGEESSTSFAKGFLLQFVNVKIYMFGITALTGYITSVSTEFPVLLLFELIIATIGTIATFTWIGIGILIQKFYLKYYRITNVILAFILLECVWSMIKM
mgnify:CR=1 FL=1|nr:LysE family transporter [uncultured Anaerosporobacter sp.]